MIIYLKNKQTLIINEFQFKCAIGKKGISKKKIEGDKKTPKGIFKLEDLYYRSDRILKPQTKLKCRKIKRNMGWCNDVKNTNFYNKLIKVNKKLRHEKLYRKDHKYDLLIPIKYNFKEPIIGLGSCIFFHLTSNYSPTAGCISLKKNDFLIFLKLITKKTKIKIC